MLPLTSHSVPSPLPIPRLWSVLVDGLTVHDLVFPETREDKSRSKIGLRVFVRVCELTPNLERLCQEDG